MTKTATTAAARIARINEAFHAWGIGLVSVTQPMPKSAAKWFRVNVASLADMDAAKAVAVAVATQYGIEIVVVCW